MNKQGSRRTSNKDYQKFPIRYANCWEDSDNLLRTAQGKARILSICSGGDNTLALLLKNPSKIVAFDTNPYQIYLLKLKIAAMQNLTYTEVLILLGIETGDRMSLYQRLQPHLSLEINDFFAAHPEYIEHGLIHIGKFEHYFQLFAQRIGPLFASKATLQKFANINDLSEQIHFYNTKINNRRLRLLFNFFFGFRAMGKFGRDKNYYNHVPENDKRNNARDIKQRFDYGVSHIINRTNPYINYVLTNQFSKDCLPTYLQPQNYTRICKNLDKIEFLNGNLLDVKGKFDYFNLSDIFEYMDEQSFQQNANHLAKLADDNAKIVYYNMQNPRYIDQANTQFQKLDSASHDGFEQNRAYFYRDFLVYRKVKK